ncbi:uncharacterized protein PODANS_2_1990 [Podospora anserina S mat+]|uniref:Fatty acid-binding protein n=1 Tax=Podospora anserina (strain S / ATCC MYA-4624 / DSM 980 / FGSC 10383) TaxID=515849 RepID=B2B4P6_PODAN|nr:uncharacterized protein PODANS_2_1990 [Podospora anserina S mat+]CAP72771.1 unnamed protein product [Podospora anserina S mat+]CDP25168.1 Putative fatty acid-binding protein [Podospora anserina S mat+]
MSLANDKFPSSAAFDAINQAISASDADRKEAIKAGNAVFAFVLKNKAGETDEWHIDLKNKGAVGKGLGEKPTGMFTPEKNKNWKDCLLMCVVCGNSHPLPLRRRLWRSCRRQGQCAETVHVWQAQDQGRCHEGYQAGSYS